MTLGPEVGDLCAEVGFAPYPEQSLLHDDTFALDRTGRAAAFESAVVCARQQLKTGFLKQAALGWLFVSRQPLVVWSAHEFRTSQEAFRDMENLIDGSDMLRRRVKKVSRGNGDEAIELLDGPRLMFKARTNGGGRGLTGHKVVLDEAFALTAAHMGALLPTLTSVDDPQVVYASSAGLLASAVLREVRDRGRAGAPGLAYSEWGSERVACESGTCAHKPGTAGCALDRVDLWRLANPVTARRDPSMQATLRLRHALPPSEFMRECLGWWDDPAGAAGGGIDAAEWAVLADASDERPTGVSLGVAMTPDRSTVSIGLVGRRADGWLQAELVEHRRATTSWVAPRLVDLVERHRPSAVVLDPMGAEAGLVPELEASGLDLSMVRVGDYAAACGRVFDLVRASQDRGESQADAASLGLRHYPSLDLDAAVESAGIKPLPRGGWLWRQVGESPIEPLRAITLAMTTVEQAQGDGLGVW